MTVLRRLAARRRPRPHQQWEDPVPRILSGVQPTGALHLGNYIGAGQSEVGYAPRSRT
jgi:hypothetical protein